MGLFSSLALDIRYYNVCLCLRLLLFVCCFDLVGGFVLCGFGCGLFSGFWVWFFVGFVWFGCVFGFVVFAWVVRGCLSLFLFLWIFRYWVCIGLF